MQIVVGVSDAKASSDQADTLITYSLGSCIGVCLYDAKAQVGGMLHFQLPSAAADKQRAAERPCLFADSGMQWLLTEMEKLGASKRRMKVWIAGAAQMLDDQKIFDIGRRNHAAIRKIFWQLGMFISAEHVGGKTPRTLLLSIADGSTSIRMNRETITL